MNEKQLQFPGAEFQLSTDGDLLILTARSIASRSMCTDMRLSPDNLVVLIGILQDSLDEIGPDYRPARDESAESESQPIPVRVPFDLLVRTISSCVSTDLLAHLSCMSKIGLKIAAETHKSNLNEISNLSSNQKDT